MEKRSLKNILIAATMALSATTATVTEADAQQVKNVVKAFMKNLPKKAIM